MADANQIVVCMQIYAHESLNEALANSFQYQNKRHDDAEPEDLCPPKTSFASGPVAIDLAL
jgi:hypothetical protein